jgi:myo-inositol-1(or 4)-monophosphatase
LRWIVDPLDGTVNFLFGIPVWAVSIAVEDRDGGLVGIVHDPSRRETFTATRGGGAYLNGTRINVSGCEELARALVGTGFSYDARIRASQAGIVSRLLPEVRDIRRAGSAALDLAWLACGRLDGFYEAPMEAWDRAAGVLIIREAGGVVTDLPPRLGSGVGVIAANPALHSELVARVE